MPQGAPDVLIMGPPCQGFSLLNKGGEGDEQNNAQMASLPPSPSSASASF